MSPVIPTTHYRDAPAMIDWLCTHLGFERHAVYEDGQGGILHAELTLGGGMIMLGSVRDSDFARLLGQGGDQGGGGMSLYLVVADPDSLHERVVEGGGEIVLPLTDQDYGGRDFSFRDPEGRLWTLGSYDPWAAKEVEG